jgi:hypothetical protein
MVRKTSSSVVMEMPYELMPSLRSLYSSSSNRRGKYETAWNGSWKLISLPLELSGRASVT